MWNSMSVDLITIERLDITLAKTLSAGKVSYLEYRFQLRWISASSRMESIQHNQLDT